MTDTPDAILRAVLDAAGRMHGHLRRSHDQVGSRLPLDAEKVRKLSDEDIDLLDLYLSRFGKLQDFMVGKLFRALARASLEDTSQDVSVLDTLNRMEKFGVIDDVDGWFKARLLRNAFAHEYLTDEKAIADNINDAWNLYPLLVRTLDNVRGFCQHHIFRADDDDRDD